MKDEKELFERKWTIDGMIPNKSIIRRRILRKIEFDALFYVIFLVVVVGYGLYTGIIYVVFPFFIAFFIVLFLIIVVVSYYTGIDPFARAKIKIRSFKRDIGKK